MGQRYAIDLIDDEILIYFPYNRENNSALREYTRATDLRWDRRRRAYCLSAAAADSPEVCHNLRGFASRRGLRLDNGVGARLGAIITSSTAHRVRAEIDAIERKLSTQLFPNPAVDGEGDLGGLNARLRELEAMMKWPGFVRRPSTCRFASPGRLFHVRYGGGDEGTLVISAVDIDGYDRVSPNKPVGRALETGRIGDRFPLREGRGSMTILDITD
ncbi:hypothetical protein [Actinomadura sp. NPDC049753]|uniref:hypothetical protein n=1 Tax=Actinomadura sp. NPDC049753 TaxID=3154739 RepID=UPI00343D4ABC